MATDLRKTGISVVGDVPWGTHFCTFYETKQDLLDILVPYFKTGLESKEFCLWIVSNAELITTDEAKAALGEAVSDLDRYLAEGRIEIVSHDQWFLKNGVFDFHRVAYGFKEKLDEALANGYAGLRINGSPAWIQAEDADVLREFEGEADHFFADEHIIASCTYPLGESRTDFLLDVARNHQFTVARRQGEWEVLETPQLIQAKQEIQRLNDELEQRVSERTRELAAANEELRKEIAERQQAEAALRGSEDRLRLAIHTTPVMAWRMRPDGVVDFLNQRWMDYAGLSLEQYVQDPTGPVHPEDLPRVVEKWRRNMAAGEPNEDEMRLRQADGEYRWFLVRNAPLRDEQGNVVNWYGVSIDIEERKRAENELRRQKEILQQIFDHIPVMISLVNADGRIMLVNREWERTLGWSLEEIRHQNLDIFAECYPDPQYRQEVLKFVAEAESKWVDFKTRVRDGRAIDTSFVRVHLSDGTSIGIGKDITERKAAEKALDERLRFETVVTELSAAFANLSPNEVDREIDKWLQTLVEFLGVDRASFFQFGEDWTTLYRSHSYTVPGIEPLPPPPIVLKDQFPWITDQLRRGVTVKWSRIPDDMPEEAAKEKEYGARLGVKSGLNIPVRVGGSVICAIAFTSMETYRDWPDAMVARLRLVGEIFAVAVERKRAEAALRKSEEQFRQMAENIREVFWLSTGDFGDSLFNILYVSPAYESVWGRTRESLYRDPHSFIDAIHPEDRARVTDVNQRDREQGFEVEYRVVRPDGSMRWIRDRGFRIKDAAGRFYRVTGIAEDITERKQAEEKLKRSESQLAEAQRLAHVGSFDWDVRSNAVTWSDELYRIFGLQPGEINVAGDAMSFIHPEDRDLILSTVKTAVKNKQPYSFYYRVLRPDGDERIVHTRGHIVSDEDGEPIRVFGATEDVTELKRAEEKLKASSEQLRALSASVQSAKEEEGTRIAREIHDELGGALTSLKWDLESFHRVISESNGQPLLQALQGKVEAMLRLSETTISVVRRISSELRPSVLDDLGLAAAIEWQARQFQTRTGIICHCDCSLENVELSAEQSTAIFRILQEALTNILRHAQATRVEIAIKEEAGEIVLTVSDNGRGITEDEKSRLQSLGLLGMRERAHLIGGAIDINGVEAKGTVVTVRVPLQTSHGAGPSRK